MPAEVTRRQLERWLLRNGFDRGTLLGELKKQDPAGERRTD
jgi:hypothetical protein